MPSRTPPTSQPGASRHGRRGKRKRRYRQTPAGLEAKRAAAHRHKPWLHSTGPRTPAGKRRSALNALRHGLDSAEAEAYRRTLAAVMRLVRSHGQGAEPAAIEAETSDAPFPLQTSLTITQVAERTKDGAVPEVGTTVCMTGTNGNDTLPAIRFGKTRRALFGLFFSRPDGWVHLREVVRLSGTGVGAVQRELALLARAGILERSARRNLVLYRADPQCPVYAELKSLVAKTLGVAGVLREALAPLGGRIDAAFVFGPFASGRFGMDSDVDVMVIGRATASEMSDATDRLRERFGREVNPVVYPVEEYRQKVRQGKPFLKRMLEGPKVFLIGVEDELAELARLAEQRVAATAGGAAV